MILSRSRRFIFVHVPKTAGTAFSLAYEAGAAEDDILVGDTPKAHRRVGRLWKHSTLQDLAGLLPEAEIRACVVATLVRNPWDRVLSYYHWLRLQTFAHQAVSLAKGHDFSGFLNHPHTCRSLQRWQYGAYLRLADGADVTGHPIRIEHYAADVAPIEAHLGRRLELSRVNVGTRPRDWAQHYSDKDARLVAELCAQDILRFGYSFTGE